MSHDLNAFVKERQLKLREPLRKLFHYQMTSYDTEEPAFALILLEAINHILGLINPLDNIIVDLARKYRYTIMNGRTHGQEAELQSFGKRCLTWHVQLAHGIQRLKSSKANLHQTKLSGAIGNYDSIDPPLEQIALALLGLKPFVGATQIIPRERYLPTAQSLCQIAQTIGKISTDIRLMARSGLPLAQEPFGKKQIPSSAMPHKKNTISTEKNCGMVKIATGNLHMIEMTLDTWEERDINQSSVERVGWPDLCHVTAHAITTLTKVLKNLSVYPDNMIQEIANSRGCYAAASAKDWPKEKGSAVGLNEDDAYRIVQLAAFNVFQPDDWSRQMREHPSTSLEEADKQLSSAVNDWRRDRPISICVLISTGQLMMSKDLSASLDEIVKWNKALRQLFSGGDLWDDWLKLFTPSHLLRNESFIFEQILGDRAD